LQIKEIPPQPTQSCCCSRCALLPSIERVPRPTYSGRGGRSIIPTPTPTMVATAAAAARGEGRERNHSAAARARSGSTPSSSSERGEKKIRFGLSLFPLSHAVDWLLAQWIERELEWSVHFRPASLVGIFVWGWFLGGRWVPVPAMPCSNFGVRGENSALACVAINFFLLVVSIYFAASFCLGLNPSAGSRVLGDFISTSRARPI
jgi:hypothetical protein